MPGQAPPALRAPGAPVGPALRAPGAPVGLYNEGATCYLNALLQLLFMLPVREAILKWRPDESDDASGDDASPPAAPSADLKITGELQRLFARLVLGNARAASTRDLVAAFGWSGAEALEQQDVSECLNVLCDRGFHGSARAALDELCGGTTVTVLERKDGTRRRWSGEPAPGVRDGGERGEERGHARDDVEVDCAATGERVAHSKREAIASPPGALFLTLKRFAMDWDAMDRVKDERPVDVPARLALGGADYGLCGALLHVGTCAEFNHWFGWS
ncbi:thiol-dependent ubiquitin-specific protease [Aureococcus anophagefferens]|nr:thiol-dependent ubiquitin-specific protease [Aureococcus anophagefferens]